MPAIGWVLGGAAVIILTWLVRDRLVDLAMRVSVGTNMVTVRPSRNRSTRRMGRRSER